jgi:hypothetical protein
VARQYSIFPLKENDRHLFVATSDPTNFAAEQALGFISGRKAVFEVAPPPVHPGRHQRATAPMASSSRS